MTGRRGAVLVLVVAAVATAVYGAAATLGVSSARIDTFEAGVGASTSTSSSSTSSSSTSSSTTSSSTPTDTTAPQLVSLEFFDTDADGKVDQVKATFNEALATYTAGNAPWTLTNAPGGAGNTLATNGVSVSGTVATLTLNEGDVNTGPGTAPNVFKVALAQNANGIRDAAGNQSSFAATNVTDKAAPRVLSREYFDTGTPDGKIDLVRVTYTEPMGSAGTTSNWTVGAAPTGMSANPNSATVNGAAIDLRWTVAADLSDAPATGPALTLALTGSTVADAATPSNAAAPFAATAVADKAGPIPTSLLISNAGGGGTATGRPERDDTVVATFSEALAPASACPGESGDFSLGGNDVFTATITDGNPEVLSLASTSAECSGTPRFGTVSLGAGNYASSTRTFAGSGANATEFAWSTGARTLTLTLGAASGSGSDSNNRTATYTPNASLADLAGNLVTGTVSRTAVHF